MRTAALLSLPVIAASAAAMDDEQLHARLDALESRLAAIESGGADGWLDEQRAAATRAVVADALADADRRMLLQDAATAGYDNGFYLRSADGNYELKVQGRMQLRFVYNHQDSSPTGNDDAWGFEVARVRLAVLGHLIDPGWQYKVSMNVVAQRVADAWVRRDLGDGWMLMVGQFKLPFTREFFEAPWTQLSVDRSLVDTFFRLGRSQGVELSTARWSCARSSSCCSEQILKVW